MGQKKQIKELLNQERKDNKKVNGFSSKGCLLNIV